MSSVKTILSPSKRREKRTLLRPRQILQSNDFEASLHQLPLTLCSEIKLVFPDLATRKSRKGEMQLLAIPTYHEATFPILERNNTTEEERLRFFLRFKKFAVKLTNELKKIDSSSFVDIPDIDGVATFSSTSGTIYDEVSSTRSILGYSTFLYMGVQIVQHPRIHYSKLAVHTVLIHARPDDAKQAFVNLEEAMLCTTNMLER